MASKGGSKSRARTKERRKKERKAIKEANKRKYEAWRDAGSNKKDKRSKTKGRNRVAARKHQTNNCGNPGCNKCTPLNYSPFLKNGVPDRMPPWMYKKWLKEANDDK